MERLILLCLLSPAIFAWQYKTKDPNDEPFLPIHPVYPYSPKLMKRDVETEVNSQLTSELYAPKVDAKDTYSSSYSSNYQRDSYYPDYNPYPTNSTPSYNYPTYYNGGEAYVYADARYPVYNSYPAAYAVNPASYPNYYYQPPYYYPHYFNSALFSPPPPPPADVSYHETLREVSEDDKQDASKKGERLKEDETIQNAPASQFVDGGNYIVGNSRDLDVQSSTYKVANPYNQVTQDAQVRNLSTPLPKMTYKVISVGRQSADQNYPVHAVYVKAQQLEQMTNQALADLLAQNVRQRTSSTYESGANDGSYQNQDAYNSNAPSYTSLPATRSKTGVAYVIDAVGIAKVNQERAKQQSSPSQRASSKNPKHSYVYAPKPASRSHSQISYSSPESASNQRARVTSGRSAGDKYSSYDASQSYSDPYSQSVNKQKQNYGTYQNQPSSYQSDSLAVAPQTPRSYTYQYSAYSESDQEQQPKEDEINTDDGNFGIKQYKQ